MRWTKINIQTFPIKLPLLSLLLTIIPHTSPAQTFNWYSSTPPKTWETKSITLKNKKQNALLTITPNSHPIVTFNAWGVTFNELDWDALNLLDSNKQKEILTNVFSPQGDLRITRGRISMNANDYARSWYSCDEIAGDLELRFFNINRDKQAIIPFIHNAQKYNADLTFWLSPWSPPTWMKINNDYPVLSSPYNQMPDSLDYILYGDTGGTTNADEMKLTSQRGDKFPHQLATTDYMIQDPRYLQSYALYFCKFIDAYKQEGINIDMVTYQNEAYSYTPYPGCAWTAEATIRFNRDYLGPTLKKLHPNVKLYLGTFNTNRTDYVQKIASDTILQDYICGMAFQWEGREALPTLRTMYPKWSFMCSESECGWGNFDWDAAEHTFELINHYLGNGCNEYCFWNFILADNGESPWGWKQNALIRVDSQAGTFTYTPEYYAVKHYSRFIPKGSEIMSYKPQGENNMPLLIVRNPEGKNVVIAGNFNDEPASISVEINNKMLTARLPAHSFNTFVEE